MYNNYFYRHSLLSIICIMRKMPNNHSVFRVHSSGKTPPYIITSSKLKMSKPPLAFKSALPPTSQSPQTNCQSISLLTLAIKRRPTSHHPKQNLHVLCNPSTLFSHHFTTMPHSISRRSRAILLAHTFFPNTRAALKVAPREPRALFNPLLHVCVQARFARPLFFSGSHALAPRYSSAGANLS